MTQEDTTPRRATGADTDAVLRIAAGSGLFTEGELAAFAPMITDGIGGPALWLVTGAGAAMAEPEPFSGGVWNLRFIAVLPDRRRAGTGRRLLSAIEAAVAEKAARMLLVDTDGSAAFAGVQAFYAASGYDREACIRDYYGTDHDKVTFRRRV